MLHVGGPAISLRRLAGLALIAMVTLGACRALPAGLFGSDPSSMPGPTPIAEAMCQSAEDLRVDVEALRSISISEDGLVPLIGAVDAALGEARTLGTLVVAEYRPLVADVAVALQALRDIAQQLEAQDTIGAGVATIGEAITDIGEAMEALGRQMREPCPADQLAGAD